MRDAFRELMTVHIREHLIKYIAAAIILLTGIITGAVAAGLVDESYLLELSEVFSGFVNFLARGENIEQGIIFRSALLQNSKILFLIWLSGMFFFGTLPIIIVLFYRGFSIGFTVGLLAQQESLRGVIFALASILPQNLFYMPMLLLSGVCGITSSMFLLKRRFAGQRLPNNFILQYTVLMVIAGLLMFIGCIAEAVITPVFMRVVANML